MATKAAALQAWLEGFGLPVYRDSAVPGEAKMPYITYDLPTAAFGTQCNSEVNLWFRTSSEAAPNSKAEEVAPGVGTVGRVAAVRRRRHVGDAGRAVLQRHGRRGQRREAPNHQPDH